MKHKYNHIDFFFTLSLSFMLRNKPLELFIARYTVV